jgi:hypothetical protein
VLERGAFPRASRTGSSPMTCSDDRGLARLSLLSVRGDTPLPLKKLDQLDQMVRGEPNLSSPVTEGRALVFRIPACSPLAARPRRP